MQSIYEVAKKPDTSNTAPLLSPKEERQFNQLYQRIQVMHADAIHVKFSLLSGQLVLLFHALKRIYDHAQQASRP